MQHQDNITINEVVQTLRTEESDKNIKKKKLFAIIIDAARPKLIASTQDYMQTIKIIDPSYNGFMTLFYFCKSLEDCAPIESIGEIVLLKRYHYQLYNNEPQAKKNAFKTSQLLLFGLEDLELKFNPNDSRQLSDEEFNCLKSIQIFGIHHLTNFSLTNLFWYSNSNANIYDILLKIDKYDENTVHLLDSSNQSYSLVSSTIAKSQIPIGTIVKLRSISISFQNEIIIHDFSSLLLVPLFAFDNLNFDKLDQQIIKMDSQADTYTQYNPKSITKIKKKYTKSQPTLIRDILDEQFHLIQAEIVGISPTSLKDALVYYNNTHSFTYSQAIEQNINIQGMSSTLNVQIQLNQNNQLFTVYLIKNDEFFGFEQIVAENIDILNIKYQQILQKILLNEESVYGDLVIQLLSGAQQNIYRIVDTQIQP